MKKSACILSIHALCAVVLLVAGMSCLHAKPMDSLMGQQVPALQRIASGIRKNGGLSEEDIATVAKCIDSGDPVLLSAAAWIVGEYKEKDNSLLEKLKALRQGKLDKMPEAFVRIALEKCEARKMERQWKPRPDMLKDANPYLRLEVMRELLLVNQDDGVAATGKLSEDEDPLVEFAARGICLKAALGSPDMHGLLLDERHELLLTIISGNR